MFCDGLKDEIESMVFCVVVLNVGVFLLYVMLNLLVLSVLKVIMMDKEWVVVVGLMFFSVRLYFIWLLLLKDLVSGLKLIVIKVLGWNVKKVFYRGKLDN